MQYRITDYNDASNLFVNKYSQEWEEIKLGIEETKIHLKASDQRGLVGTPIFDPVGTNKALKTEFKSNGWRDNLSIPKEFNFLGTDIDFEKEGIIVEVQFSNYPFLLNNILRSELFYKAKTVFNSKPSNSLIIITKAGKFPSSNSTLYYEQAKKQLDSFSKHQLFQIPTRLVGLFPKINQNNGIVWTKYDNPRYSRTVEEQSDETWRVEEDGKRYRFNNV